MALDLNVGDNVQDIITLYWKPSGSTIQFYRLYGSTVSAPAFAGILIDGNIPNYPSQGPFRGCVVRQLSRSGDLGITNNAPYYFRITEVNSNGVESSLANSPERGLAPEVGPRFAKDLDIIASANFPVNPQFNWGFLSQGISLLNLTGADTVDYSFDGVTVHGRLGPLGSPDNGMVFDIRYERKVWFRVPVDSTIRVEVWDHSY